MLSLQTLSTAVTNEFYKKHHYSARASHTDWCIGGYLNSHLIIAGRVIDYSNIFWLRSLFCDPKFRRQQYGKTYLSILYQELITHKKEHMKNSDNKINIKPDKPIIAFADSKLNGLYDAAGWHKLSEPNISLPKALSSRIKSQSVFASGGKDSI